jgi:hypothetical protein
VAVVVVVAVVFGVTAVFLRRLLQQRFGPEYDRLVVSATAGARRKPS